MDVAVLPRQSPRPLQEKHSLSSNPSSARTGPPSEQSYPGNDISPLTTMSSNPQSRPMVTLTSTAPPAQSKLESTQPFSDFDVDSPPATAPAHGDISLWEFLATTAPPTQTQTKHSSQPEPQPRIAKRHSLSIKDWLNFPPTVSQSKVPPRKLTKRAKRGMSMSGLSSSSSPPKISPPMSITSKPSLPYELRRVDSGKPYYQITVRPAEPINQLERSKTVVEAGTAGSLRKPSPRRPASSVYSDKRSASGASTRPPTAPTIDPNHLAAIARLEADRASTPDHFKGRASGAGDALSSNPPTMDRPASHMPIPTSRVFPGPSPPPTAPLPQIPQMPNDEVPPPRSRGKSFSETREKAIRERKLRDRDAIRARHQSVSSNAEARGDAGEGGRPFSIASTHVLLNGASSVKGKIEGLSTNVPVFEPSVEHTSVDKEVDMLNERVAELERMLDSQKTSEQRLLERIAVLEEERDGWREHCNEMLRA